MLGFFHGSLSVAVSLQGFDFLSFLIESMKSSHSSVKYFRAFPIELTLGVCLTLLSPAKRKIIPFFLLAQNMINFAQKALEKVSQKLRNQMKQLHKRANTTEKCSQTPRKCPKLKLMQSQRKPIKTNKTRKSTALRNPLKNYQKESQSHRKPLKNTQKSIRIRNSRNTSTQKQIIWKKHQKTEQTSRKPTKT